MKQIKMKLYLAIFLGTSFLPTGVAQAFCSCWDAGTWAAATPTGGSGSHCGGAIDWDTATLDHGACKDICSIMWPGYSWAYVDQIAFKKCKIQNIQNPSKIIPPSINMKEAVSELLKCKLKASGKILAAFFSAGVSWMFTGSKISCDDIREKLKNM